MDETPGTSSHNNETSDGPFISQSESSMETNTDLEEPSIETDIEPVDVEVVQKCLSEPRLCRDSGEGQVSLVMCTMWYMFIRTKVPLGKSFPTIFEGDGQKCWLVN